MKYLYFPVLILAGSAPAWAQDATGGDIGGAGEATVCTGECMTEHIRDDAYTILVTGATTSLIDAGQSVSVVGAQELAAIQGPDLTRVLERLPGVAFSRNGGLGAQTGLYVRGANADQLLVMIDGVRIADYASPGGGYDLGNLLSGDLARVELLRGSNSVVWGSQAIGGVLSVETREVSGLEATGEYGADNTAVLTGSAGLAGNSSALSLDGGYARTDGISALAAGHERDGYRQWHVSGKGRLELASGLTLRGVARHADSRLDIDLTGPDAHDVQNTRETSARAGLDYQGDGLTLTGGATWGEVRRHYKTAWGPSSYTGSAWRAEGKGHASLGGNLSLDFGADSEWSRARSSYDPQAKARLSSGHALLGWSGSGLTLAGGARIDDHSRFGSHATFGANGSARLGGLWRARASYGEGFKAPTLYQLHGGYVGNVALKPEKSSSVDLGIERGLRGDAGLHVALGLFRRDSRNLIDLDSNFVYQNVARARAQGIELELGARPSARWHVMAAYTYLDAKDRDTRRALARRPHHALSLSADWTTPLAGLELGADLRLASDSVEYAFGGGMTRLDGYAVGTLRARLPVSERIDLTGRIENVTDTRYETAAGYGTAGRSAYVGVKARF